MEAMQLLRKAKRIPASLALAMNRRIYTRKPAQVLTADQNTFWKDNGFLVLDRFFTPENMDDVNRFVDDIWVSSKTSRRPTVVDIFIGTPRERRTLLSDAPLEAKAQPYKLNDLFLESDLVRSVVLEERLSLILEELLGAPPLACNTLNLEFGSQQSDHYDSLYMAAPVGYNLVATWIALEDNTLDAGPLRYYPGSHKIPPYRFSTGLIHAVDAEMPKFREYMATEVAKRGLPLERFVAHKGDVFIWHSQLFHGGEAIADKKQTRRSLVTHYWRACDLKGVHGKVGTGRYYLVRAQQPIDAPVDDH